jgi:hypothetical protein
VKVFWRNVDLVLLLAFLIAGAYVLGYQSYPQFGQLRCPTSLSDGRYLRSMRADHTKCVYAWPRRTVDEYSPAELRGMAATRERMSKIK